MPASMATAQVSEVRCPEAGSVHASGRCVLVAAMSGRMLLACVLMVLYDVLVSWLRMQCLLIWTTEDMRFQLAFEVLLKL